MSKLRRNNSSFLQYAKQLQDKLVYRPYWNEQSLKKADGLHQISQVKIGEAGCFKYILIEIIDQNIGSNVSKFVVRGDATCACDSEIVEKFVAKIDEEKITYRCRGGGRIRIDPARRTISIFGFSIVRCSIFLNETEDLFSLASVFEQFQKFGQADHRLTFNLLKKKYSEWNIVITNEDY